MAGEKNALIDRVKTNNHLFPARATRRATLSERWLKKSVFEFLDEKKQQH